jgi:hypothetical protein
MQSKFGIWLKNKFHRFCLRTSWFLKRNFLDTKGRIDVTRIGQFGGLIAISILTWVAVVWFINGTKGVQLEQLAILMGESAAPMLLYRVKEWVGNQGSSFEYPEVITGKYAKGFRKFLRDNLTDGRGRIDTGRIGNIQGVVAMSVVVFYSMYVLIVLQQPIDEKHLAIVGGGSSFPMVMYRLKDLFNRKENSRKEEES